MIYMLMPNETMLEGGHIK